MENKIVKYSMLMLLLLSLRNVISNYIGFDNKILAFISVGLVVVATKAFFKYKEEIDGIFKILLLIFMGWVYFTVARSILDIKDKYYLLTFIAMAPSFMFVLSVTYLSKSSILKSIYTTFFTIIIPLSILFIPIFLHNLEVVGFYFVLLCIPLLLIEDLTFKRKLLVILLAIVVGYISYISYARSTVVKFFLSVGVYVAFNYFPRLSKIVAKPIVIFILALPFFLLIRSITTEKSFFTEVEEITSSNSVNPDENTVDTRTFLYYEAIVSAVDNNYVLWGRNFSHGYDSILKSDINNTTSQSLNERLCEVGILNVFTCLGLVGAILFYSVLAFASVKAVLFSRNVTMVKFGVFLAFTAFYTWVENAFYFDYTTLSILIVISLCVNEKLINSDEQSVRGFFKAIFN